MKKERNNMNQNFEEIKEKFNAADIDEKNTNLYYSTRFNCRAI